MTKQVIIDSLYRNNIVINRPEGIKLKSGKVSNIYVNFRSIGNSPGLFYFIVRELSSLILNKVYKPRLDTPTIVGIPTMGTSLGISTAYNLSFPFALIRQRMKEHGIGNKIEGDLTSHIILVDDVITSGASVQETIDLIDPLWNSKPYKFDIVTIVDRQDHSLENVHSLLTLDEIINGGDSYEDIR
jgi:orotate phosphoribosyltransferase